MRFVKKDIFSRQAHRTLYPSSIGRTQQTLYLYFIETARPPASYDATAASAPPPAAAARRLDEAETEGAWVRRWDAVAGGAGADWATCLRLLERAAADVALDGAVSTAAS